MGVERWKRGIIFSSWMFSSWHRNQEMEDRSVLVKWNISCKIIKVIPNKIPKRGNAWIKLCWKWMKENTLKIKRNKIGIKYSWIISQRLESRTDIKEKPNRNPGDKEPKSFVLRFKGLGRNVSG